MSGSRWFWSVLGWVGNLILLVALVAGIAIGVSLFNLPAWIAVPVVCVVVLVVLMRGAYLQWQEAEAMRVKAEQEQLERGPGITMFGNISSGNLGHGFNIQGIDPQRIQGLPGDKTDEDDD